MSNSRTRELDSNRSRFGAREDRVNQGGSSQSTAAVGDGRDALSSQSQMDGNSGCTGIVVVQVLKDGKASASCVMMNEGMNHLLCCRSLRNVLATFAKCS